MPFYEPDVVAEAKKLDLLTYLQKIGALKNE